ncbi:chloride channel protein 3, partial [Hortaea werneckii]
SSPHQLNGHASSSRSPLSSASPPGDDDEGAELANGLLEEEDPLHGDGSNFDESSSFKPKPKAAAHSSLTARFLSSPFARSRNASPAPDPSNPTTNTILSYLNNPTNAGGDLQSTKDATTSDWYVEGPGRRVGYDNLTAIDWIYEYNKERTRLRQLTVNAPGLLGQVKSILDASQIWLVLVATGIAVGSIAAGIDVASDWMGDLKQGVCSNVQDGGKFYLSRPFCCWGVNSYAECHDWRAWSTMLGVSNRVGSYIIEYIAFVLLSVAFATCASTLVNKYSLYAKQSGIPEIKTVLGGFVIRRFLGAWTLVVKSLGLCLAVASGMWLGKEGPLVHVACCCANVFMKLFAPSTISANEARKREAFSAAAASGISVAFGSPIGGVLFSLEQLSYYFPDKTMWASFVCAMVAAVTLQAFDPFRTGKLVLYQVSYHSGWHAFELVPFALIGILGGLYGAMFIKLNMRIASRRASARNIFVQRPVLEVLIVALATALISFPITFLRAQSSELVEHLFAECKDIQDDYLGLCRAGIANTGVIFALILSGLLGFLLTTVTFGLQIPAGILLPSMAIGATYGRVVGLVMEVWQQQHPNFIAFSTCEPDIPCVTPGTYAVIGAASALAGATRMTVSIVVIMFELTGALTYVLPIMIAVMLSKWVGDAFGKRGIYESWISIQGYPFLDNKIDDAVVPDVPVNNIMTRVEDLICITATGHTISSLQELLQERQFRGYPVIASLRDPTLLGYISRTELAFALSTAVAPSPSGRELPPETECFFAHQPLADPTITLDLRPWMDQTPITLNSRTTFQLARDMFEKLGLRYLVFTDRGELAGLLTKKDLWQPSTAVSEVKILTSQNYQLLPASTMKLLALSSTFLSAATTLALPGRSWHKPAYFVLAGDSTTAVQASGGGGWGDGFLNHTLRSPATGENLGHNGATTVSFREGGDWAHALELVEQHEKWWDVFVTIQFGHNDQKPKANISLDEYSKNLGDFVDEVRSAGGTPILVTPLTRRSFFGDPPRIVESLSNETAATIAVAKSKHARYIDLNLASTEYCNEIGPEACHMYNLNDGGEVEKLNGEDNTHLNVWGSIVFGRMVSDLMVEKYWDIAFWTKPNVTMSWEIEHGVAV